MKSSSHILESPSAGKKHDFLYHDIGLKSSLNYEEHLLEFGSHSNCSCLECRASFEGYTDKELEEMLYSNGATPNNYVLSSERWTLNQDTQQGAKKLTIDKEFEQGDKFGVDNLWWNCKFLVTYWCMCCELQILLKKIVFFSLSILAFSEMNILLSQMRIFQYFFTCNSFLAEIDKTMRWFISNEIEP
nr:uncharacterized protein LOC113692352 [Coffea arabica]